MDLKATYESHCAAANQTRNRHAKRRAKLIEEIERELQPLEDFDAVMRSVPDSCGVPLRSMIDRRIHLNDRVPELSPLEWEQIPFYADWHRHRTQMHELGTAVREIQPDGVLSHHALHLLSGNVADADRPLEFVTRCLQDSSARIERLTSRIDSIDPRSGSSEKLSQLLGAVEYATQAAFLARAGALHILHETSDSAQRLQRDLKKVRRCDKKVSKVQNATQAWREKLPAGETEIALDQARRLEGRIFSVFSPTWWRLRGTLNRAYDFSQHRIRPSWVRILEQLRDEHDAISKRSQIAESICDSLGIEEDFDQFESQLSLLRETVAGLPEPLREFHDRLLTSESGSETVLSLAAIAGDLNQLLATFDPFLEFYHHRSLAQLADDLRAIEDSLDELPDYLHCLGLLDGVSEAVVAPLRTLPLTLPELEAATAERSLQVVWREARSAARFDGTARRRQAFRLGRLCDEWQKLNAECVREQVRQQFVENVNTVSKPAAQLSSEQKEFKKVYNRGRRELEHEFGKSMRYKSIRDLVADESGLVVRDLKPVWLMSPLSVSDTLPLDTNNFDVVIFDEASQITLEEAVPSIFRAEQIIVVGDEMQLPPTSFFTSRNRDDEDELTFEENGEIVQYDLDSNSFLNHAARNLQSRMLGWHYRSRSESLISFSNHAFYDGRLLTVPGERLPSHGGKELVAETPEDASRYADELLDRTVSFHFMQNGIYEKRRNAEEAAYIAGLVRRILERDEGHSIGIVAFSEAQQEEIESALQMLAERDSEFARRLELELEREEDEQFVGLLVKNLENIQGDERDIIIMSVCYGPNREGKIRMNFGPIIRSDSLLQPVIRIITSRKSAGCSVVSWDEDLHFDKMRDRICCSATRTRRSRSSTKTRTIATLKNP